MAQPDLKSLCLAVPDILAAPDDGAAISHLCLRPGRGERQFVDEIMLTQAQGIPGERWMTAPWVRTKEGAPHPGIQVCILSRRVLDLVWNGGVGETHPGDTFVVDMNLTERNLPIGQLLCVGTATLQVSELFNDACVKWKGRYGLDAFEWVRAPENRALRLRGILCRVVHDGVIKTGDRLNKIVLGQA